MFFCKAFLELVYGVTSMRFSGRCKPIPNETVPTIEAGAPTRVSLDHTSIIPQSLNMFAQQRMSSNEAKLAEALCVAFEKDFSIQLSLGD